MRSGEYSLHVFIERTRGLCSPTDNEKNLDPVLEIKAFGESQHSNKKSDIGIEDVYWGQHYYFSKSINNYHEMENEKLSIKVLDHNAILANSLVGSFDIDLTSIYFKTDHALLYRWLAISNPEKDISKIYGFVKVSVSLVNGDDK